jgi:hypothetical protein
LSYRPQGYSGYGETHQQGKGDGRDKKLSLIHFGFLHFDGDNSKASVFSFQGWGCRID